MKTLFSIFVCFIAFFSCKDDGNQDTNEKTEVLGLTYSISSKNFKTTDATILSGLEALEPIRIVAEVNHRNNAVSVNKELDSTKVILFGNPKLGTPLMQKNRLVGLDLPQKIFIWKSFSSNIRIGFNDTSYLQSRYDLGAIEELTTIQKALTSFTNFAGNGEYVNNNNGTLSKEEGIITKKSTKNFEETYDALVAAIKGNENLKLIAELDHQANAESVNLELKPTRLIVFGNPNLGTPLMQNMQTIGIDLPQKFLVWEDDEGTVMISYNDPEFLQKRHKITDQNEILTTITGALDNLSNAAAGL